MTARIVDVDALNLDLGHARCLQDLAESVVMQRLDGAMDLDQCQLAVRELYALIEATRDRISSIDKQIESAARPAPVEGVAQ